MSGYLLDNTGASSINQAGGVGALETISKSATITMTDVTQLELIQNPRLEPAVRTALTDWLDSGAVGTKSTQIGQDLIEGKGEYPGAGDRSILEALNSPEHQNDIVISDDKNFLKSLPPGTQTISTSEVAPFSWTVCRLAVYAVTMATSRIAS